MSAMIGDGVDYTCDLVASIGIATSGGSSGTTGFFSMVRMEAIGSTQYYRSLHVAGVQQRDLILREETR